MPEDEDSERDAGTGSNTAPIDYDILERLGRRLDGSNRFRSVEYRPTYAPNAVVFEFDGGYFPAAVEHASLRVRWYENDDFTVHYAEHYRDDTRWECRWDCHPNAHNAREHFHPPPDATTPGSGPFRPTGAM